MNTILITGCNRGIGLGLVKQILKENTTGPKCLIATCRDIGKATELKTIADQNQNLCLLEIDLNNFNAYDHFSKDVASILGENGLNVLVNNAGISSKFTRLSLVKSQQLLDAFTINTIAPIMLTKALYPMLKKASEKNCQLPMGSSRAAVVMLSSILGSISGNVDGGLYPYKCSKAALNMATKSMSIDFKNDKILTVALHPGWVKTDMGGKNAPLDVETSAEDIIKLLADLNEEHNGQYLQHNGQKLDW